MAAQSAPAPVNAALIWLDSSHALVARRRDGGTAVTSVDRALDSEPGFLLRVAHEAADCDRLVVMGSDAARIAFEREYVAVYRHPDRLVDDPASAEPGPRELADRLRLLSQLIADPA
jgi:DNA-binding GntR family transcriptional regulator